MYLGEEVITCDKAEMFLWSIPKEKEIKWLVESWIWYLTQVSSFLESKEAASLLVGG